jgi:hypothetical protein
MLKTAAPLIVAAEAATSEDLEHPRPRFTVMGRMLLNSNWLASSWCSMTAWAVRSKTKGGQRFKNLEAINSPRSGLRW